MSATNTACGSKSAKLALAASLLWCGCAAKPLVDQPAPQPRAVPFVVPPAANFELVVTEAVNGPEEDTAALTKIYVDGKLAGQTPVAPRSQPRKWADVVSAGNHLFRFEQWYLPQVGEWGVLDSQWQPPERFFRVEDGARTSVSLKFSDGGRRYELSVSRAPLPSAVNKP